MDEDKCQQCGTPASPGAKYCESCGAPLKGAEPSPPLTAPSEPPEGQREGAPSYAPPPGYQAPPPYAPGVVSPYQGVAIRFVAILIDYIIIGIIASILTAPLVASAVTTNAATGTVTFRAGYALAGIIGFAVWLLYFTLLEGRYGQTVGKMAVKIRVVKEADGSPITYEQSAVRNILRIIDAIIFYLVGAVLIWSSDRKQRLGDRIGHTIVVKA